MSVTNYIRNCDYALGELVNIVYLIDASKALINIDGITANITSVDDTDVIAIKTRTLQLTEETSFDERYAFTHTLSFSVNGYLNSLAEKYYVIVQTKDGKKWMLNPQMPAKVTYTYTLSNNDERTEFTMATISNHPTLEVMEMPSSSIAECKYNYCRFKRLKLNERLYSARRDNEIIYTNDGFKEIDFLKNSATLVEEYNGKIVRTSIRFTIPMDSDWYYHLLEFKDNKYAAIVQNTCGKYMLCGFGLGLQPSYTLQNANNSRLGIVEVTLTEVHDFGLGLGYYDSIVTGGEIREWRVVHPTSDPNSYVCDNCALERWVKTNQTICMEE